MIINDKEEKINSIIQEITGKKPDIDKEIYLDLLKENRVFKIKKILIFSSSFDYFLLEEEGRLKTLFSEISKYDDKYVSPDITHTETEKDCLTILENDVFDILIIFNKIKKTDIIILSKKIKKKLIPNNTEFVPADLVYTLCRYGIITPEQKDAYLNELNKLYRNYLRFQDEMAKDMMKLIPPNFDKMKEPVEKSREKIAKR